MIISGQLSGSESELLFWTFQICDPYSWFSYQQKIDNKVFQVCTVGSPEKLPMSSCKSTRHFLSSEILQNTAMEMINISKTAKDDDASGGDPLEEKIVFDTRTFKQIQQLKRQNKRLQVVAISAVVLLALTLLVFLIVFFSDRILKKGDKVFLYGIKINPYFFCEPLQSRTWKKLMLPSPFCSAVQLACWATDHLCPCRFAARYPHQATPSAWLAVRRWWPLFPSFTPNIAMLSGTTKNRAGR